MKLKRFMPVLLAAALSVSALAGCGNAIDGEKAGATLDGEEISLGFMNFMARYQQAIYDSYFGTGIWTQDLTGDGSSMEDSVKSQVAEEIETLYLLEKHMADYNVEITKEEQTKIDEAAQKFMDDNTKKAITQIGATTEYVKEMLRLSTIQSKMRAAMDAEVDTEVSDEEAAQKAISYVRVDNTSTTDEDGETIEYTEEEKEALKSDLEAFITLAADDFEGAAETAGYTASDHTYGEDDVTLDDAVKEAADKLKDGEISDIVTTDDSYYVIRMNSTFDEEATESKKEEIVENRKNDHYTEVCDGYKEEAEFVLNEEEWAKVKFDEYFTLKQVEATEGDTTDDSTDTDSTDDMEDAESVDSTDDTDSTEDAE